MEFSLERVDEIYSGVKSVRFIESFYSKMNAS